MADKVCELIEHEDLRRQMGNKAKQNIARYSEEKIMGQWKDLFEELVNRNGHDR